MIRLSTSMAIFWMLAEGSIVFAIHWGLIRLQGRRYSEAGMWIGAAVFALLVIILAVGREWLVWSDDFDPGSRQFSIYRTFTWNFFCTVWVVLEAVIAFYAWRIYSVLKRKPATPSSDRMGLIALILAPLSLYLAYHYMAWSVINSTDIGAQPIVNLGRFYIRLCGLFWISIEGFIAVMGFRMVRLLRQPTAAGV